MLEHDVIINRCDSKRDQLGLEALSVPERVISLVSWADFEIENGSLSQFYYNRAGDDAVQMCGRSTRLGHSKRLTRLSRQMGY
jgi:hypothetical protein